MSATENQAVRGRFAGETFALAATRWAEWCRARRGNEQLADLLDDLATAMGFTEIQRRMDLREGLRQFLDAAGGEGLVLGGVDAGDLYMKMFGHLHLPGPAAQLFYLQDTRTHTGNCPMWWRKGGAGYTTRIDEAETLTLDQAMRRHKVRDTDIPWPVEKIDALVRPTIDMQNLGSYDAQADAFQKLVKGVEP